jgi:hypothetical protein
MTGCQFLVRNYVLCESKMSAHRYNASGIPLIISKGERERECVCERERDE